MTRVSEDALERMLKDNPQLMVSEAVVAKRPRIPVEVGNDNLVREFVALWKLLGGQTLEKEYRFATDRKWRLDFAHLASKVAIEIHGGVWSQGRHVRGAGFLRDREKMNAAQTLGWSVFEFGTGQVTPDNLQKVIDYINEREH